MKAKILGVLGLCMVGVLLVGAGCKKAPETPARKKAAQTPSGKTTPATPAKSAASSEPIKIGAIFAVTGPAANLGARRPRRPTCSSRG